MPCMPFPKLEGGRSTDFPILVHRGGFPRFRSWFEATAVLTRAAAAAARMWITRRQYAESLTCTLSDAIETVPRM